MGWLIFDGISVLFVFTLCVLLLILMGIFAHRQITRLRNNNARNKPNIHLPFSKKAIKAVDSQLDRVQNLILSYQPRLTDCITISQHSNAPYVNRMIAVDEIGLEIDYQLSRIDEGYARLPGEETYDYLIRLRSKIPNLPVSLCQNIAFLHHSARFSPQKFDVQHLMEVRSLLNQFVKIINCQVPSPGTAAMNISNKLSAPASRRIRTKFGGSDDSESDDGYEIKGSMSVPHDESHCVEVGFLQLKNEWRFSHQEHKRLLREGEDRAIRINRFSAEDYAETNYLRTGLQRVFTPAVINFRSCDKVSLFVL